MTIVLPYWTCDKCRLDLDGTDEMPVAGMICAKCFAEANAREQIADVIERLRAGEPFTSWARVEMIACLMEASRCIDTMTGKKLEVVE